MALHHIVPLRWNDLGIWAAKGGVPMATFEIAVHLACASKAATKAGDYYAGIRSAAAWEQVR